MPKERKNKIFMEATPLRLLLNKLPLFSRKQNVYFNSNCCPYICATCFGL